jgi:2-polyprenyl-3-methyl-5-hydroxy-6-metoxy-1,4-benzoquinol methylase
MTTTPRYDSHAEWYLDYTSDWGSVLEDHLPQTLEGRKVLDLCCGWGTLSRTLVARGADVVAVDLSSRLIDRARQLQRDSPDGIRYLVGDAATTDWWDGEPFDHVVSNMALMDVDDLDGVLDTVGRVLAPSGRFSLAIFHPCFPVSDHTLPSWPEAGYSAEGWWTTGEAGVRGHVGAHHRTLSTYLNALIAAGLVLDRVIEPPAAVPTLLIAECRPAPPTRAGQLSGQQA